MSSYYWVGNALKKKRLKTKTPKDDILMYGPKISELTRIQFQEWFRFLIMRDTAFQFTFLCWKYLEVFFNYIFIEVIKIQVTLSLFYM